MKSRMKDKWKISYPVVEVRGKRGMQVITHEPGRHSDLARIEMEWNRITGKTEQSKDAG